MQEEKLTGKERQELIEAIQGHVQTTYVDQFHDAQDDGSRRKLGLAKFDDDARALFDDLFRLMASQSGSGGIDYTLFWRALSCPPPPEGGATAGTAGMGAEDAAAAGLAAPSAQLGALRAILEAAALDDVDTWPTEHTEAWTAWGERYWARVRSEESADLSQSERLAMMRAANPKYILRNWMAMEAYDAANRGDYTIVNELHEVLTRPYDEQGADIDAKYAQVTPKWARQRAGLAFLS